MDTQFRSQFLTKGASTEIKQNGFLLNHAGIQQWLVSKNIISDKYRLVEYIDLEEWHQAGAETYTCSFEIKVITETEALSLCVLVKAIMSLLPTRRLFDWARRRSVLSESAIPVSNWYWHGKGTIIEEFYPNDYTKVHELGDIESIAVKLDSLGFECLSFLRDIRCDAKGRPFYVDFGFDLGEPSSVKKKCAVKQFQDYLCKRMVK